MPKKTIDSSILDKAIIFATEAHRNVERKGKGFPYIVHPMEAVAIVASMTSDQELLAAAALHDVVEDTPTTVEDIRKAFGDRIADLVDTESDIVVEGMDKGQSWHLRKQVAIDRLAHTSHDAKVVAMGDKLSNMRAIYRDYVEKGDALWDIFRVKERSEHEWHYRGLAASLSELSDTFAYKEFLWLIRQVFGDDKQ